MEGNYQIIISREKQVLGCAGSIIVEQNGAIVGKLKVGKSIMIMPQGWSDVISFSIGRKRKDVRVDISEQSPVVYLSAKLNMSGDIEVTRSGWSNNRNYLDYPKTKRKHSILKGIGAALLIIIALFVVFGELENDDVEKSSTSNELKNSANSAMDKPQADTSFDTSSYIEIDADLLFEYGAYLGGKDVVTVITAETVGNSSKEIKAKTSNNNGSFFSVICKFDQETNLEKGAAITVAGSVKEVEKTSTLLDTPTVTLENCVLIGFGEIADELETGADNQRQTCETAKQELEARIEAEKQQEIDEYASQCVSVDYSDVERNPDNYKGEKVKISGKVIQVSEGLLGGVTLRVSCNGNVWYVTYSRDEGESRILENDTITCYGECDGVQSYLTVLGAQVTIPSMKMKYYN